MGKEELRAGIIGCGDIAFKKHMKGLEKTGKVKITGFCDFDESRMELARQQFGTGDSKVYKDYRRLLEDPAIDMVHICTAHKTHAAITVEALLAGKHVICEKPISSDLQSAKQVMKVYETSGKKLTYGLQHRFKNECIKLKELCRSGCLGDIYMAKAHAIRRRRAPTTGVFLQKDKSGGGCLLDYGSHALDQTLWLMDNFKPYSVTGTAFYKLGKNKNSYNGEFPPWNPETFTVEDSAFAYIVMENGAAVFLESSYAINMPRDNYVKSTLCGTLGGADMEDGLRINREASGCFQSCPQDVGIIYGDTKENYEQARYRQISQWVECVLNDTEPLVLPQEAFVSMKILDAVYRSSETGKTIYF